MKLDTYTCDRCKEEFTIESGATPPQVILSDERSKDNQKTFQELHDDWYEQKDVCIECFSSINWAFEAWKKVDAVIEKIVEKAEEKVDE